MAKGQRRSNREPRKPKAKKSPAAMAVSTLSAKGIPKPTGIPKRKR